MKKQLEAWASKAEDDLRVAEREWRASGKRSFDAICFHGQQCLEKYLKARLLAAGKPLPRTHDLGLLLQQCAPFEPLWVPFRAAFERVSAYSVRSRYPGFSCTRDDAHFTLKACRQARKTFRHALGLKA